MQGIQLFSVSVIESRKIVANTDRAVHHHVTPRRTTLHQEMFETAEIDTQNLDDD